MPLLGRDADTDRHTMAAKCCGGARLHWVGAGCCDVLTSVLWSATVTGWVTSTTQQRGGSIESDDARTLAMHVISTSACAVVVAPMVFHFARCTNRRYAACLTFAGGGTVALLMLVGELLSGGVVVGMAFAASGKTIFELGRLDDGARTTSSTTGGFLVALYSSRAIFFCVACGVYAIIDAATAHDPQAIVHASAGCILLANIAGAAFSATAPGGAHVEPSPDTAVLLPRDKHTRQPPNVVCVAVREILCSMFPVQDVLRLGSDGPAIPILVVAVSGMHLGLVGSTFAHAVWIMKHCDLSAAVAALYSAIWSAGNAIAVVSAGAHLGPTSLAIGAVGYAGRSVALVVDGTVTIGVAHAAALLYVVAAALAYPVYTNTRARLWRVSGEKHSYHVARVMSALDNIGRCIAGGSLVFFSKVLTVSQTPAATGTLPEHSRPLLVCIVIEVLFYLLSFAAPRASTK